MTDDSKDLGVSIALLDKFAKQTLPRAYEMKKRIDSGERLDQWDIDFLHQLFGRAEEIKPLVERNPQYQEIYAQAVHLYKEITEKALVNEKGTTPPT
jgi:hypothetical protein